jgi:hypothetical protein
MLHDAAPETAPESTRSTVFIVDDHPIVRQGLALLINREPDLAVCGDAEEAGSALRRIEEMTSLSMGPMAWICSRTFGRAIRICRS